MTGDDDDVTASRALACVSRAVRTQQGAGVVVDIGGTAILTRALSRWAVRGREGEREMGLESCVRALALVESQRGESGAEMIEEGAVASLVAVVADKGVSDATAGNASVLIGQLAKAPEGARALADADGVKALVGAMLDRKGTAQRNAAVACAKAVQQRADLLERLKELHGIEIMYRYVRP